jgi:hypothetical protein
LRLQNAAGVLSQRVAVVDSRMPKYWARTSWWAMTSANSKSEFVTVPVGKHMRLVAVE